MAKKRTLIFLFGALLMLAACGSSAPTTTAASEASTSATDTAETNTAEPDETSEDISDAPASLAIADDETPVDEDTDGGDTPGDEQSTTTSTTTTSTTTTTEAVVPTCSAPELQAHFVDVALDDPDGGLNMRSAPGPTNSILNTFARGKELITTGECTPVGTTEWWQVTTSDGGETGWVSSRFLTDTPVESMELGARIEDPDLDGLASESLDATIDLLADRYGFGGDRVVTFIDGAGADAQGGSATYEVTGLKDDAIGGYRFEIDYFFVKSEPQALEIIGIDPFRVTTQAICNRGVTPDGLCI